MLVPRYPADAGAVLQRVVARGLRGVRKTAVDAGAEPAPGRGGVLVVDTVGELGRLYAIGDLACPEAFEAFLDDQRPCRSGDGAQRHWMMHRLFLRRSRFAAPLDPGPGGRAAFGIKPAAGRRARGSRAEPAGSAG